MESVLPQKSKLSIWLGILLASISILIQSSHGLQINLTQDGNPVIVYGVYSAGSPQDLNAIDGVSYDVDKYRYDFELSFILPNIADQYSPDAGYSLCPAGSLDSSDDVYCGNTLGIDKGEKGWVRSNHSAELSPSIINYAEICSEFKLDTRAGDNANDALSIYLAENSTGEFTQYQVAQYTGSSAASFQTEALYCWDVSSYLDTFQKARYISFWLEYYEADDRDQDIFDDRHYYNLSYSQYRVEVRHNSTGIPPGFQPSSINSTLIFKSNANGYYDLEIYNYSSSTWESCTQIYIDPNIWYQRWCNSSSPSHYISPTHNITIRIRSYDDLSGRLYQDYLQYYLTGYDLLSPIYLEYGQNRSLVHKNQSISLYSLWEDNIRINSSSLEWNATLDGSYANVSLIQLDSPSGWANFSLGFDPGVVPGIKGWRIHSWDYNDTPNYNSTPMLSFELWGWAKITNITQDRRVAQGSIIELSCNVTDKDSSQPIQGYNVSFYYDSSFIGWNLSNSSGIASVYWNTSNVPLGSYNVSCILEPYNSSLFYNASEFNIAGFNVTIEAVDTSFSLSLAPPCSQINFTPSLSSFSNLPPECQNANPILNFTNQGNVELRWDIYLNSSLDPQLILRWNNTSSPPGYPLDINPVTVAIDIPVGGNASLWLWLNGNQAPPGEFFRDLISESSQS